jgi:hypothetical protein
MVVVMAWISTSGWYILSTLSAVGRDVSFGGLAAVDSARPYSFLMEGANPLVRDGVEAKSILRILSILSEGLCRGGSCDRAVAAACPSASSFRSCAASCSMHGG